MNEQQKIEAPDDAADTDELHTAPTEIDQVEPQPEPSEPQPELEQDDDGDDEPQAVNPQPAQRLPEPQPEPEPEPAKRGRGRPRKTPAPEPQPAPAPAPAPEPAKPKGKAKPKLPDLGAAVAPQLDAKRQQQLDAVKGLLQLQASKIASLACMAVGWEPLNAEESVLVDAEFDGWTPPEEMRKVVIVGIVALPRALGDNRCRKLVGLPLLGAAGDAPAARAAEVAASVAPPPPVVEQPAVVQAQPAPQPAPPPAEEQRPDDLIQLVSPLFVGAGAARVPKGFV